MRPESQREWLYVVRGLPDEALLVAAEYALVTARRGRLEEKAEKGSRSAKAAVRLLDEPVRLISTIQIAITLFGIALGAIGEPLVSELLDGLPRTLSFILAFVVLTYIAAAFGGSSLRVSTDKRISTCERIIPDRCSV